MAEESTRTAVEAASLQELLRKHKAESDKTVVIANPATGPRYVAIDPISFDETEIKAVVNEIDAHLFLPPPLGAEDDGPK